MSDVFNTELIEDDEDIDFGSLDELEDDAVDFGDADFDDSEIDGDDLEDSFDFDDDTVDFTDDSDDFVDDSDDFTEESFDDEELSEDMDLSDSDDLTEEYESLNNNNEITDDLDDSFEFDDDKLQSDMSFSEEEQHDDDYDDASLYTDGAIVDDVDLHDEDVTVTYEDETGFISDSGSIVVQDTNDDAENGFELIYLPIDKIAITQRIRKMQSVEGLTQSIQSTGLLMPVVVTETKTEGIYVLLSGYRRLQACARAGKVKIPCIVNHKVNTPEIPILEAMYNHSQRYSIREQVDYINHLETEKGIMNPAMIEYLLQMNSGDYTKLKDILNDNDEDIVTKLFDGAYDIATAFRKLEQRRKKETAEEKENKKAARVYDDEAESGADKIAGSGEEADGRALTEEQISALAISVDDLSDENLENESLSEMIEEDADIEGFKPHKQKTGEREYIDPIIKKSVMTRDNSTCQCCKRGGMQYADILDYHHIIPVFLGGPDTVVNGLMLCVACHRLVHLYSTDDLKVDNALLENSYTDLNDEQKSRYENEEIFEDEKRRFKRVILLGSKIRKAIAQSGLNKEQYKKEHSNTGIGRRKPGVNAEQERT